MNASAQCSTIYQLAEELHIPERKVIDFSTPVNPLGVSKKVKAEIRQHLKYLYRYPDDDSRRLRRKLGQYHSIDPETILCGNGTTELIYLIARAVKPHSALIPVPTSPVYERACRIHADTALFHFELRREHNFDLDPEEFVDTLKAALPTIAFLGNPNNPTGRLMDKKSVKKIADTARNCGCFFVVDESYSEFGAGDSMIDETSDNEYLIVLRSMSHYYALAGIRFGYGIFPSDQIERLKAVREPWAVNSIAQISAGAALKDRAYRKESVAVMRSEKAFLERNFRKLGIAFFPSDANFYLVETPLAADICRRLRSKGILICDCADMRGLRGSYLRIAVRSHRENAVLIRELTRIIKRE